jgi:hypothetical protein
MDRGSPHPTTTTAAVTHLKVAQTGAFGGDPLQEVARYVQWTDGGAEFVYRDGSVLSFCAWMDTAVALYPPTSTSSGAKRTGSSPSGIRASPSAGAPTLNRVLFVTAMTLSTESQRVINALALYNAYNERPKLISGLLPPQLGEFQLWPYGTPIESCVLKVDDTLLEEVFFNSAGSPLDGNRSRMPLSSTDANTSQSVVEGQKPGSKGASKSVHGLEDDDQCLGYRLWDAMKITSMTLSPNMRTFTVRWPAVVLSPDGSRNVFPTNGVLEADSSAMHPSSSVELGTTTSRSNRRILRHTQRYVMLEQEFSTLSPPATWKPMLSVLLGMMQMRRARTQGSGKESQSSAYVAPFEEGASFVFTLPETLPSRLGGEPSSSAHGTPNTSLISGIPPLRNSLAGLNNSALSNSTTLLPQPTSQLRFSPAQTEDLYPLAANPLTFSAQCNLRLHPVKGTQSGTGSRQVPQVQLFWERDMALCLLSEAATGEEGGGAEFSSISVVESIVFEDRTHLVSIPLQESTGASTTTAAFKVTHTRNAARTLPQSHPLRGGDSDEQGRAEDSSGVYVPVSRDYFVDGDGTGGLPPIVDHVVARALEREDSSLTHDLVIMRGRYLPQIAQLSVAMLKVNAERRRAADFPSDVAGLAITAGSQVIPGAGLGSAGPKGDWRLFASTGRPIPTRESSVVQSRGNEADTSGMSGLDVAQRSAPGQGIVKCSSRVDGVGIFTAYFDGTVRAVFDDRTIVTLSTDRYNSTEGLVCTLLNSSAILSSVRVTQCSPQHPAYPYLMYVMPFYDFSKLPEDAQKSFIADPATSQLSNIGGHPSAVGVNYPMPIDSQLAFRPAGIDVDALLYRTKEKLHEVEVSHQKSLELLKK